MRKRTKCGNSIRTRRLEKPGDSRFHDPPGIMKPRGISGCEPSVVESAWDREKRRGTSGGRTAPRVSTHCRHARQDPTHKTQDERFYHGYRRYVRGCSRLTSRRAPRLGDVSRLLRQHESIFSIQLGARCRACSSRLGRWDLAGRRPRSRRGCTEVHTPRLALLLGLERHDRISRVRAGKAPPCDRSFAPTRLLVLARDPRSNRPGEHDREESTECTSEPTPLETTTAHPSLASPPCRPRSQASPPPARSAARPPRSPPPRRSPPGRRRSPPAFPWLPSRRPRRRPRRPRRARSAPRSSPRTNPTAPARTPRTRARARR